MERKILLILCLLLLNNCATSGTALLGPIFTGAKTGSVYQASLSYGSGKIMKQFNNSDSFKKFTNEKPITGLNLKKQNLLSIPYTTEDPIILISYKVEKINYSEIDEIEHLP